MRFSIIGQNYFLLLCNYLNVIASDPKLIDLCHHSIHNVANYDVFIFFIRVHRFQEIELVINKNELHSEVMYYFINIASKISRIRL